MTAGEIVLHNYFRSSTSFRVRACLNLKGIAYRHVAHHLRKGEHRQPAFLAINPQGLLPSLQWSDGTILNQSLAILEFLDESVPLPPMLPASPAERARVRALAQVVACDIHPVNNLRVLNRLREQFGADEAAVAQWFRHFVRASFDPLEEMLAASPQTGRFCHGDSISLADLCLLGQTLNNSRFGIDNAEWPTIAAIHDRAMGVEAIAAAAPANQPDAE
jgi:maleylpyruvate isomerase